MLCLNTICEAILQRVGSCICEQNHYVLRVQSTVLRSVDFHNPEKLTHTGDRLIRIARYFAPSIIVGLTLSSYHRNVITLDLNTHLYYYQSNSNY